MSECMTFDVFAAEEKYQNEELTSAADIVQSILNEALLSIFPNSEKVSDSNRIGDCTIGEEFSPKFGFAPANPSECNLRKIYETHQEKKSDGCEKPKEYGVIEEQALADGELRIQKGKILLQKNDFQVERKSVKEDSCIANKARNCSDKESEPSIGSVSTPDVKERFDETEEITTIDKPFTPLTAEDFRQSVLRGWKDVNSELFNGSLSGELVNQPQEAIRLMEELSTLKSAPPDPNRPRSCTLVEEDVKKQMTREIEEINFNSTLKSFSALEFPSENRNDRGKTREGTGCDEEEATVGKAAIYAFPNEVEPSEQEPKGQNFKGSFNIQYLPKSNGEMLATCLTESDEAFIESSEGVLQIIEPREDSNDENEEGDSIRFSLLDDSDTENYQKDEELAVENYDQLNFGSKESFRQEDLGNSPRIRSGMTTVGPVKDLNYDPKFLAGPEVDYGKMTKITGSTVLRNDSTTDSLTSSSSKKICVDDGDDNTLIFFENGYVELDELINHDIASLTKVQKVKEVLSDQPKSNEDFKGEEKLAKSLDLKDVDAESVDSYNVLDSGIPFLVVDERHRNSNKELNVNFQISAYENNVPNFSDSSEAQGRSLSEVEDTPPAASVKEKEMGKPLKIDECQHSSFSCNKSVTQINVSQNQKHNTISRVLQKASNRFIMKDSDSFLRNSKSLPRDTTKMANTESFKSLLDDCQTSAATVLKKSRSLLRNTQNVLKTVSRTGFGHTVSGDKEVSVTQETIAEQAESKQSTSLKNNGFLKFKDSLKTKVGKTLRSLESISPGENGCEPEIPAIRNETENFKKISPKSPLVYTTQVSADEKKISPAVSKGSRQKEEESETFEDPGAMESKSQDKVIEVICGVKFQGSRRGLVPQTISNTVSDDNSNQSDYIPEETDEGIKKIEESSEKFQNDTGIPSGHTFREIYTDIGKNSVLPEDIRSEDEGSEELNEKEDDGGEKSLSSGKLRKKSKKLSERIRSFWHGAFGKVKASPQRKNLS